MKTTLIYYDHNICFVTALSCFRPLPATPLSFYPLSLDWGSSSLVFCFLANYTFALDGRILSTVTAPSSFLTLWLSMYSFSLCCQLFSEYYHYSIAQDTTNYCIFTFQRGKKTHLKPTLQHETCG